jgi:hypothetical protein
MSGHAFSIPTQNGLLGQIYCSCFLGFYRQRLVEEGGREENGTAIPKE